MEETLEQLEEQILARARATSSKNKKRISTEEASQPDMTALQGRYRQAWLKKHCPDELAKLELLDAQCEEAETKCEEHDDFMEKEKTRLEKIMDELDIEFHRVHDASREQQRVVDRFTRDAIAHIGKRLKESK